MMDIREFHNGLRVLTSVDRHELVEAGVIGAEDEGAWKSFQHNPFIWFIQADDGQVEAMKGLMQRRMS